MNYNNCSSPYAPVVCICSNKDNYDIQCTACLKMVHSKCYNVNIELVDISDFLCIKCRLSNFEPRMIIVRIIHKTLTFLFKPNSLQGIGYLKKYEAININESNVVKGSPKNYDNKNKEMEQEYDNKDKWKLICFCTAIHPDSQTNGQLQNYHNKKQHVDWSAYKWPSNNISIKFNQIALPYDIEQVALIPPEINYLDNLSFNYQIKFNEQLDKESIFGFAVVYLRPDTIVYNNIINNSNQQDNYNNWKIRYKNASVEGICKVCLKDPITLNSLAIPARGAYCNHLNCFDLLNYIQVNNNIKENRWQCPICRKKVFYFQLDVDFYLYSIIEQLKFKYGQNKFNQISDIQFMSEGDIITNLDQLLNSQNKVSQPSKDSSSIEVEETFYQNSKEIQVTSSEREQSNQSQQNNILSDITNQMIDSNKKELKINNELDQSPFSLFSTPNQNCCNIKDNCQTINQNNDIQLQMEDFIPKASQEINKNKQISDEFILDYEIINKLIKKFTTFQNSKQKLNLENSKIIIEFILKIEKLDELKNFRIIEAQYFLNEIYPYTTNLEDIMFLVMQDFSLHKTLYSICSQAFHDFEHYKVIGYFLLCYAKNLESLNLLLLKIYSQDKNLISDLRPMIEQLLAITFITLNEDQYLRNLGINQRGIGNIFGILLNSFCITFKMVSIYHKFQIIYLLSNYISDLYLPKQINDIGICVDFLYQMFKDLPQIKEIKNSNFGKNKFLPFIEILQKLYCPPNKKVVTTQEKKQLKNFVQFFKIFIDRLFPQQVNWFQLYMLWDVHNYAYNYQ